MVKLKKTPDPSFHPLLRPLRDAFIVTFTGIFALYTPAYRATIQPDYGLTIESSSTGQDIIYELAGVTRLLDERYESFKAALSQPNCMFVGYAFETLKTTYGDYPRIRDHPTVQFLRHARNAAFHGNRFHFRGNEPTKPAVWRSKEITRSMQGTTLFFDFLDTGDVIWLLSDISSLL